MENRIPFFLPSHCRNLNFYFKTSDKTFLAAPSFIAWWEQGCVFQPDTPAQRQTPRGSLALNGMTAVTLWKTGQSKVRATASNAVG